MFPVNKANFFSEKNTGFLSHSSHETAAAFDESDESEDGVFLPFFLS